MTVWYRLTSTNVRNVCISTFPDVADNATDDMYIRTVPMWLFSAVFENSFTVVTYVKQSLLSLRLFPFTKYFYHLEEVVCLWKQQLHYYCIYLASGNTGS